MRLSCRHILLPKRGTEVVPYQIQPENSLGIQESFNGNRSTYEAGGGKAAGWIAGAIFAIGLLVLFSYIGDDDRSHSTRSSTTGSAMSSAPAAGGSNGNIISVPSPFEAGAADRRGWGNWLASIGGDYRAGAEFGAGQRSLKEPTPCDARSAAADSNIDLWIAGCRAAQERLAPINFRRNMDREYRKGWNNP